MPIRLYDSLTRDLQELRRPDPRDPLDVFGFYNCGLTVYAAGHIGNFRTFVVNDVLRRLLELEYGPGKVRHVRNLTDVDDKTIRRAREEGRPLGEVTRQWTEKFHADCVALNCLPPHEEPRAADARFLREQVSMIEVLLAKGNAYCAADGSVYFKVSSFDGYGRLSRVHERELQVGATLKTAAADADEKDDVSDFALWKAHKPDDGDVQWPGPAGAAAGRPGWHIECSAMSKALLGNTIDLHTGGVDLLFPHHENEIAQSECCNGTPFARHWYHSEHLLMDGKKMSKSLGNLYTLDQLTALGHRPAALRYALLMGHPRKQLSFSFDSLHAAESALKQLRQFRESLVASVTARASSVSTLSPASPPPAPSPVSTAPATTAPVPLTTVFAPAFAALRDDLNTPAALGALFSAIHQVPKDAGTAADLAAFDRLTRDLLGLDLTPPPVAPTVAIPPDIAALAEQRWAAKAAKNFAGADALRKELTAQGWTMLDRKDGYSLEPAKK